MTQPTSPSPQRVLVPLGLGTAVSLLGDGTLYTVLPNPDIAAQAGVTLGMVGVLLGINRLTRVVLNGPVGLLYDRLPRRGLLLISLFVGALSTALFAVARGPFPLLASRVLWGLAWSGIWIGGNTMVLDISSDQNRGRLSGQYQMWFFGGAASASLLGGTFTDLFGFRGGLGLSAALTALAALMWVFLLPETRPLQDKSARQKEDISPSRPFPWRVTLAAAVPLFVMRFVFAGVLAATSILWLEGFFGQGLNLPLLTIPLATLTGIFGAARTLMSVGGAPLAGVLSDRLERRWAVMALSLALGVGGIWLMGGTVQLPALLGALLAAIAGGSVQALVPAIIGDRSGTSQQGRALSVLFTVGDLGSALGPPLALGLLSLLSIGEIYRLSAGVMAAVLLFALWQSRVEQKASQSSR